MTKLEELKAAYEAATSGEWKVRQERAYKACNSKVECEAGYVVAEGYSTPSVKLTYNQLWAEAEGNTNFIALAHNNMAALLEAVELLKLSAVMIENEYPETDERYSVAVRANALLEELK